MGPLDWLDYYRVGMDVGLLTLDDLTDFLDRELVRYPEPPAPYVEASFAVLNGRRATLNCLSELFADARFTPGFQPDCPVERALLGLLRVRYQSGELDLEETALCLSRLSLHYEPHSLMNVVADYYDLAEEGVCYTIEEVRQMVEKLLERGAALTI